MFPASFQNFLQGLKDLVGIFYDGCTMTDDGWLVTDDGCFLQGLKDLVGISYDGGMMFPT